MRLASEQLKKFSKFFSVHLFTKVYEPLLFNIKQAENHTQSQAIHYTKCKKRKLKMAGLPPSKRSFNVISLTHHSVILGQSWFSPSEPSHPTPSPVSIHPGPAILFLH